MAVMLLGCGLALALGSAQAHAAPKGVVDFFGSSGTAGGEFNTPRGVAVSQTNGDIYVVDSANHRIQRFDALRNFVSAWGIDVVPAGGAGNVPVNEQQTISVVATGGTFTLTFSGQPTDAIAFDATPAAVQAALEGLSNVEPGDAVVTGDPGGPWTVEFAGTLADTDVAELTGNADNLEGDPKSVTVATAVQGASAFETCTLAMSCKQGSAGLATDAPAGELSRPQGIAIDPFDGSVYVTNQDNRRVEKFSSSGAFQLAFGWNVNPEDDDDPGEVLGLETCTTSTGCQIGVAGTAASQFSTAMGYLAVDPRNQNVLVANPVNRRVQRFDSTGNFVQAIGASGSGVGQFGSGQPTRVAVDSSGSIYTVESSGTNTRRIQKFNPSGTSAALFAPEHTSATNNNLAPTDVAINPANDNVLVTKPNGPTNAIERQVLEFNLAGALIDTHAAGAGLPVANGLAVQRSSGRIYLSTGTNLNPRVFVLGPITPPSVTLDPVTEFTADSATFTGTVNPNGTAPRTGYRFEYSDDGGATWRRVPASDVIVGNQTTPQPVSQAVGLEPTTRLEPNTQYQVRLVATREFAAGSATSDVQTFTTDAAAPAISEVGAREITDTTALLAGNIDPNRSHTTYRFEYGTDTSYGTTTAVDNAGSSATRVPVSKALTGLQPNTTYHFRLVASNAAGETHGADQTFTTLGAPQPSGRVYEMVSPLDKNGGNIDPHLLTAGLKSQTGAAPSGDAAAFTSPVAFGDIEGASLNPTYLARRASTGWTTEGISPPLINDSTGTERPSLFSLSLDLSKTYLQSAADLTPEAGRLNGRWGLYARHNGQRGSYTLLSVPWQQLSADNSALRLSRIQYAADTPDARHVVFISQAQLLPDPPGGDVPDNGVYEWVDGSLRLVSVPPSGTSFDTAGADQPVAGRSSLTDEDLPGDHLISDDGRRIFFTARVTSSARHLFVREDAATTRAVSRSEPSETFAPDATIDFWAAKSSDGSVAFFTSSVPLVPQADGSSLYRWDATGTGGRHLSVLTRDDRDGVGMAGVIGPAAVSDDATSVYFVATGVLAPAGPQGGPTPGAPNLYLWKQGEGVRYIATLHGTLDSPMWAQSTEQGGRAARVSGDGERLLFASYADLDPAYDTIEATAEACGDPAQAGDACRQIYLYDARTGGRSCVTCVAGVPVTGDANLFGNSDTRRPKENGFSMTIAPLRLPRNLSADGTRAFFETSRRLVSGDQNDKQDVYEWEDRDLDGQGMIRLISPGRGSMDSKFLDASLTGDDVFFTTREQLVGIDRDNQADLYDARVGGGIPAQNPPPSQPCVGEDCQGALSGAPVLAGVASGGASHGDLRPRARPSFSLRRLSRAQLVKLARGKRVAVRVRVNRPGRVSLTARAKLGKRRRVVARASETARRAGSVTLGLKLSRSAVRELAGDGRLNVRLAARFAGVREAKTSTLRLRRARPSGEGRAR